jgi:hypothetical protein
MNNSLALGLKMKRRIALTTLVCGLPALPFLGHVSPLIWLLGMFLGFVWANGFEYAHHRLSMHTWRTPFFARHRVHHVSVGTDIEPEHTSFSGSSISVISLFALNSIPFLILDHFYHLWVTPVVVITFVIYVLALEETHWRIHMNQWVPFGTAHHLAHHDTANRHYNVFIPLFDWIFGTL